MFLLYCCHTRAPYRGLSALLGSVQSWGRRVKDTQLALRGRSFRSRASLCVAHCPPRTFLLKGCGENGPGLGTALHGCGSKAGQEGRSSCGGWGKPFPGLLMAAGCEMGSGICLGLALPLPTQPRSVLTAAVKSDEALSPRVQFAGRVSFLCSL